MKLNISACIITFNEAKNISDCIKSLYFVDEVIVVDSGSTDNTKKIAESLGAKVIENTFEGHIQQKNHALSRAKNEWVISLDADERITPSLRKEISELFENIKVNDDGTDNLCDGYMFPRRTFYIGKWIEHGGWYPDRHLRLFKNSKAKWGGTNPHDRIILDGTCGDLKSDMTHYSFNSISAHIETINRFSGIMARNLYNDGKTDYLVLRLIFKPVWKFIEMLFLKKGFLDGKHGLVIAGLSAFATFSKFSKLFELTKTGYDGKYSDVESERP